MEADDSELDDGTLPSIYHILSVCFDAIRYQRTNGTVNFTYGTAADYLELFKCADKNRECLGFACFNYLQSKSIKRSIASTIELIAHTESNPFLAYAAYFSGFHVKYSKDPKLHQQFENILNDEIILRLISRMIEQDASAQLHKLHILTWFGLEKAMFNVLRGDTLNEFDENVEDFLRRQGLERNAAVDVEMEDNEGQTSLIIACTVATVACVKILLEFGAREDGPGGDKETPLEATMRRGESFNAVLPILPKVYALAFRQDGANISEAPQTPILPCQHVPCDGWSLFLEQHEKYLRSYLGDAEYNAIIAIPLDAKVDGTIDLLLKAEALVNQTGGYWGTALNTAVAAQRSDLVQLLIDNGADVNKSAGCWGTPIETALALANLGFVGQFLRQEFSIDAALWNSGCKLRKGSLEDILAVTQVLIDNNAKVDASDQITIDVLRTAFSERFSTLGRYFTHLTDEAATNAQSVLVRCAVMESDSKVSNVILENLLNHGMSENFQGPSGQALLHLLAHHGKVQMMEIALAHGADKELKVQAGDAPLHIAAEEGYADAVKLLLDNGCNSEVRNDRGKTALMIGSAAGCKGVIELLLARGAAVDASDDFGQTSLMACAINNHLSLAEMLLKEGASIDKQSANGFTALTWASSKRHIELVRLLIREKAQVNLAAKSGTTALHEALDKRNGIEDASEIAKLLLDAGANAELKAQTDSKERKTATPLLFATDCGFANIVKTLLQKGADKNAKNGAGETSLTLACTRGLTDLVQVLVEAGADINLRNAEGDTPLRCARRNGHTEPSRYLTKKGAKDSGKSIASKMGVVEQRAFGSLKS